MRFKLKSTFKPKGSQPHAIRELVCGQKKRFQTLLGVTGSGKTFTMANVIEKLQRPTLVLAHNKTLAAQLYNEFREFFPDNRVEYFVSYYDYYQPESYLPQKDQYIEKDADVNPKIEQLRLSATASILSRGDTIIVASVSCIYGLGNPEHYRDMGFELKVKQGMKRNELIRKLVDIQYERNDLEFAEGMFRVKGDTIDLRSAYYPGTVRIELFGDAIERITEIDKDQKQTNLDYYHIYPAKHFVVPEELKKEAMKSIKEELKKRLPELDVMEAHRLKQRTLYDMEMIEETGFCKGIENYSRHFDKRKKGEKPYTLMDYFPEEFLLFIDESHRTIPQLHGMYKGDYTRKKTLVDYGFRLPSALDNRPLRFDEFLEYMRHVIFVSATPGEYELKKSKKPVEQIIRPTGLVDPLTSVRGTKNQIEDLKKEIKETVKNGDRVLVTTLTKKSAEELTEYLAENEIKSRYLHSEIDTIERTEILRELRLGVFDVLVGINLLREGIDIPEVGLICILDADKEGFLRDARSLIQIIGRGARNLRSKVILYADNVTSSMREALLETKRRREMQLLFNKKHRITPKTIKKPIKEQVIEVTDTKHIPKKEIPNLIIELETEMSEAAEKLDFERAIVLREKLGRLKDRIS